MVALVSIGLAGASRRSVSPTAGLASNPNLDSGTPLSGGAPDFTLVDQFGKRVSLHSYRGRAVLLAFNDSQCTTICPLTTAAMVEAKAMLGPAAAHVQLLGIDANPDATSVADVRAYSEAHGMVHRWHFLTGSIGQLRSVWKAYHIDVAIERDMVDHTPALFLIDPRGRLARLYLTQQSYTAVRQLALVLARDASRRLPDHPAVRSRVSLAQIPGLGPSVRTTAQRVGGGNVALGPSAAPRVYLFFATWDRQVTDLVAHLEALNAYQASMSRAGLPKLVALDEGSVEPSPRALPAFLAKLRQPLTYPVAIDSSGRIADGYGVQDEPWLTLISASGRFLWYYDISALGWPSRSALVRKLHQALKAPQKPLTLATVRAELAGSPPLLAALHAQAGRLLGGERALAARIRSLRGSPIVVNVWASWCGPCRGEFQLFASSSARYGRQVAFLGADVNDESGDARAFLSQHPVSYPTYQMSSDELTGILSSGLVGTPTTIFIDRAGEVVYVHTGQYDSQGTLDSDVVAHALGR